MALTETWLNVKDAINCVVLRNFVPEGICILHVPRLVRGCGVRFVYKNNFHARMHISFKFSSFEYMSVILKTGSFSLRFANLYRALPSTESNIKGSSFFTDFGELIEQTSNLTSKLIILGDFNIHLDTCGDSEAN